MKLRNKAIGVLNRLRDVVTDELDVYDTLPRDLESSLFAFADQTFAQRAASQSGRDKSPTPEAPTAPSTTTTTTTPQK